MLPSVHGLNDSVTGSLPRSHTVVIVPQLAKLSHLLILESLTGIPQFLTFRGVGNGTDDVVELLVGDLNPAQFGEFLLDVIGRGVNDGQCLTGIGEPQVRVTGMLHLVCLPLLRESNGSGVVADNVRARTLVCRGNGSIKTGGCQQVGPEFDTLRSDDGLQDAHLYPCDSALLQQSSTGDHKVTTGHVDNVTHGTDKRVRVVMRLVRVFGNPKGVRRVIGRVNPLLIGNLEVSTSAMGV